MRRHIRLLMALIILSLSLAEYPATSRIQARPAAPPPAVAPTATPLDLPPLPDSCGGGLPAGDHGAACCMFGYVVIDGQAVAGAKLTIASAHGSTELVTSIGPNSPQPYYRTSLSDDPLRVQVGDVITITAQYSEHSRTITHTALSDGQQVDVVLPRNQNDDDYVYDREIRRQGDPRTFLQPTGIAVDSGGTVYVADSGNARVQVFNSSGQFLRQWGTPGNGPGQFFGLTGIAIDRLDNVYTTEGRNHRVQKFSNTGAWLATWGDPHQNLGNGAGQFNTPAGIAVDAGGNMYVADRRNHRIQRLSTTGVWTTIGQGMGSGDGQFKEPLGVAIGSDGAIYVADSGNYRIQKFSAGVWTTLSNGRGAGIGQFNTAVALAVDSGDNLYVVDSGNLLDNESGNQRIQKRTSSDTWTSWDGSNSSDGRFATFEGVSVDDSGNVYVADTYHNKIRKFTDTGTQLTSWGAQSMSDGQLYGPFGVALDDNNHLFVADTGNGRVQKFTTNGGFITKWSGLGNMQFGDSQGVAVDKSGNVYVTDSGDLGSNSVHHRIEKFDNNGTFSNAWGTLGSGVGQLKNPIGIATDSGGYVYVTERDNHRIQKFTSDGQSSVTWGGPISGTLDGQFSYPRQVTVDGNDNVYVSDTGNNRIQKFTSAGTWLATWSGQISTTWQFSRPSGVAVDSGGNVYIADAHRLQKFNSNGDRLSVWGNYGAGIDQFSGPEAILVDDAGKVYVADTGNNRIEIFHPMTYTRPVATIVQATPRTITTGQPVELHGRGGVSLATGAINGYEWSLDGVPFAATPGATLQTSTLVSGTYTLSFRVHDTNGAFSTPQSATLVVAGPAEAWTYLLYLDGDNNTAPYMNDSSQLGAIYRLEHSLPNAHVTVAALYDGPQGGDSVRYLFRPDGTFSQEALGEVNMGDPQTLIGFAAWGKQQTPTAQHYYLAIADHANGLDGIAWDYTTTPTDHLTNRELRLALAAITENGAHPIDVLHFDGCLMGLLENAYQARGLARYLVSSENLAWAAFSYDTYRGLIGSHTSPQALADAIVDSYAARMRAQGQPYTIAALDLSKVSGIATTTSDLAGELVRYALASSTNRAALLTIRNRAQKLDSNGDIAITDDDEYIDLEDWAALLQSEVTSDSAVQSKAAALKSALGALRPSFIHESHASGSYAGIAVNLDNAHGIGIYYPQQASARLYQTYLGGDLTFPSDTLWDEFLAAALDSLPLDPNPDAPLPHPVAPLRRQVFLPFVRR